MSLKFVAHVTAVFILVYSVATFPQVMSRFTTESFRPSINIDDQRTCSKRSSPDGFVIGLSGVDVCFQGLKLSCYKQGWRSDSISTPMTLLPMHVALEDCGLHESFLSKIWTSSDKVDFSRAKLELQNHCEAFKIPSKFDLEKWKQVSELALARLKYKLTNPLCFAHAAAELDMQIATNSSTLADNERVEAKKYLADLNNACLKVSENNGSRW